LLIIFSDFLNITQIQHQILKDKAKFITLTIKISIFLIFFPDFSDFLNTIRTQDRV
jgi:hypothetical protein